MKMKLVALGVACLAVVLGGCVGTVDGKHKAGVPFVRDTVEAQYERPLDQVWKAAKDTLTSMGVLHVENVLGKTLEAKVDTCTVWVAVESVDPKLTRTLVQVRTRMGGTDMRLANDVDKQIAVRLASGNLMPATAPPRKP